MSTERRETSNGKWDTGDHARVYDEIQSAQVASCYKSYNAMCATWVYSCDFDVDIVPNAQYANNLQFSMGF